jgi:SDR family mycofactocin-dependent oxidoreductase
VPAARNAEEIGFDTIGLFDSVFFPRDTSSMYPYSDDGGRSHFEDKPFLDAFSVIPAMGAVTDRIAFVPCVLKLPVRLMKPADPEPRRSPDRSTRKDSLRTMSGRVEGKVALITGAARGQGRSHAVRLAEEGADIIAIDIAAPIESVSRFYPPATEADLTQTVSEVERAGRRIVSYVADVRNWAQLSAAVEAGVSQLGRLDIVAANAGIFLHNHRTHEITEQEWDDILDVNLKGVWLTIKATVPILLHQGSGGSIIITSSTAGLRGRRNVAAYTSSKHALVGLSRTLSNELAEHSIRVNTVHPTSVSTDMVHNDALYKLFLPDVAEPTREQADKILKSINALPVPYVEPADVSNAVLFLASDEARYITGSELRVDAGSASM